MTALAALLFLVISHPLMCSSTYTWMVTLFYTLVVGSVHGVLAHSLSARQKRSLIIFPVCMGAVFAVLVFVYLYVVLPLIILGAFYR